MSPRELFVVAVRVFGLVMFTGGLIGLFSALIGPVLGALFFGLALFVAANLVGTLMYGSHANMSQQHRVLDSNEFQAPS